MTNALRLTIAATEDNGEVSWIVTAVVVVFLAAIAWWLFRYARSVTRGDYRHAPDTESPWWTAGGGGHGGGGQVPPLIPDPDPDDKIR